MKRAMILGQTNVGKTLFTLNFAAFLGAQTVRVSFAEPMRNRHSRSFAMSSAITFLVSDTSHHTRCLQSVVVPLSRRKGPKHFELMDTAGLVDGIHEEEQIRRAMGQTLSMVRSADMILHLFDAASIGRGELLSAIGEVDYQVAQFAQMSQGYAVLANKMDLPDAPIGLRKLTEEFPAHPIYPISSLHRQGFQEVKEFVRRQL